jgi:hypothetical protein
VSRNTILWSIYAVFVAEAFYLDRHDKLFDFNGLLWPIKLLIWIALIGFVAYSAYCSTRENLFRTARKMSEYHWGRQIGIDLYLGFLLAMFVVYLNEGSVLATLLWLLPGLFFVNLVTLVYFAVHFEQLVGRFL